MVIMAWDHSKDFLANKKVPKDQGGSAWSGQLGDFDHNFLLFFARFISHFCAPGSSTLWGSPCFCSRSPDFSESAGPNSE